MSREPVRPTPLAEALARFLAEHPTIERRLGTATVVDAWADVVGPQIASVTRALRVTADGGLVVEVTTNGWMQELTLMERELLSRLRGAPGGDGLAKLLWVLARK
jgi:predicted nucleic acid-binding Zn ribbon protein